ncbi:beta-propeller fold lactonase family protein [Dechloromonas sp. TW-R-39-2]|uniref:YVTN family beta-propeller repeat protein n=1 Tax=Dechloromonas sp. TW-R-39-2 TaxID=2654218 RepID=UPI00193DD5D0|nr:beta-propeller fold lactonase family protein [Dechloromonas sp. TW-R-39-2]
MMIVDRDSNDIAFMDLKSRKILGRTFLGNNVNPHMAMMSPDGRYVVTGGTRANTAYVIDARTLELVKKIPVGISPEHFSFSPDGRYYYQGNPEGDSITVIDMASLSVIKTIEGLAEPLNITFTHDGSKAYVGNYGAHWVGVIDVTRHQLLKKIQIANVPGISRLDPGKYLKEIKGISMPAMSLDNRYIYAADGDLGVVGVIDTREDKVVKVIRVGQNPWRIYMGHDGKYAITVNNGDETISIIDLQRNEVAATLPAGPDMTGVNFAAGKAFVISSTTGFVYVYNMKTLKPAGRIKIGTNIQLETATTDLADEKIYLAASTDHSIYIIDGKTEAVERIPNVGLYPWGTHIMDSKDNYCH